MVRKQRSRVVRGRESVRAQPGTITYVNNPSLYRAACMNLASCSTGCNYTHHRSVGEKREEQIDVRLFRPYSRAHPSLLKAVLFIHLVSWRCAIINTPRESAPVSVTYVPASASYLCGCSTPVIVGLRCHFPAPVDQASSEVSRSWSAQLSNPLGVF